MESDSSSRNVPWPSGMKISVNEHETHILELLFIRDAWALSPKDEAPATSPKPHPGNSKRPGNDSLEEWNHRWSWAWRRAWEWYTASNSSASSPLEAPRNRLQPNQPPTPTAPPRWVTQYGSDGIDFDAYRTWAEQLRSDPLVPFEQQPERISVEALTAAWRRGLTTILALPYIGHYARRITPSHLVVSFETRHDPKAYSQALATSAN